MRKVVALLVAVASVAAMSSSIATAQTGIRKDASGPGDCYSFDNSPSFGDIERGEKPPEISVGVAGQITGLRR
jgi:hypothetical protein